MHARRTLTALAFVLFAATPVLVGNPSAGRDPAPPHHRTGSAGADATIRVEIIAAHRELAVYAGERRIADFPVSVGRDNASFLSPRDPPPQRLAPRRHYVQQGQTLWSISREYGIDVWMLRAFNQPIDIHDLQPGRQLFVPHRDVSLTPYGDFLVTNKTENPEFWLDDQRIEQFRWDRRNEFGLRWIGLSGSPYGIHGTNTPHTIGNFNSRGCVRMKNADVVQVFDLVVVGTPVFIH